MDFKEFKETAVKSGVGVILGAIFPGNTKYSIVTALPSIPSIAGSRNTIDYSTTSNLAISKIPAKKTTNEVEIPFPYTLDTDRIMKELADQDVQYAIIDLETGLGWKFIANLSYRLNDVSPDNALEGTMQLTVSHVEDTASRDMLSVYMDTATFESPIPRRITLSLANDASGKKISITTDPSGATVSATSDTSATVTASYASGALTITPKAVGTAYVSVKIASSTTYAGNQRDIYVVVEA